MIQNYVHFCKLSWFNNLLLTKVYITRRVSSMIPSARSTAPLVAIMIFTWFVLFCEILKIGDMWFGRVDQFWCYYFHLWFQSTMNSWVVWVIQVASPRQIFSRKNTLYRRPWPLSGGSSAWRTPWPSTPFSFTHFLWAFSPASSGHSVVSLPVDSREHSKLRYV